MSVELMSMATDERQADPQGAGLQTDVPIPLLRRNVFLRDTYLNYLAHTTPSTHPNFYLIPKASSATGFLSGAHLTGACISPEVGCPPHPF